MKCDNCYCAYQYQGECPLKDIHIDVSGMCTEKLYIDIDDSVLTQSKNKLLELYKENPHN